MQYDILHSWMCKIQNDCIQIKHGSRLKSLECCYCFYAKLDWRHFGCTGDMTPTIPPCQVSWKPSRGFLRSSPLSWQYFWSWAASQSLSSPTRGLPLSFPHFLFHPQDSVPPGLPSATSLIPPVYWPSRGGGVGSQEDRNTMHNFSVENKYPPAKKNRGLLLRKMRGNTQVYLKRKIKLSRYNLLKKYSLGSQKREISA